MVSRSLRLPSASDRLCINVCGDEEEGMSVESTCRVGRDSFARCSADAFFLHSFEF